jgi:predicted peptidase
MKYTIFPTACRLILVSRIGRACLRVTVAAVLAVASGIVLPSSARAQIPPGAQTINYDYDESSDGTIQSVGSLLLPKGYDPAASTTYPLVVVYHGFNEWGTNYIHMTKNIGNLLKRGYDTDLPDGGFFVYAPQAATQGWNLAKEEVTMRILARILQEHKVDKTKLYVTGLSNGGGATWTIAAQYFDIFSAAIPICGANLDADDPAGMKNEYIWAFHARDDMQNGARVINTRTKINEIRMALGYPAFTDWPIGPEDWDYESHGNHAIETPKLKYKEYGTGGHTIWNRVYSYDAMYSWMRSLHSPVTTLEVGVDLILIKPQPAQGYAAL